MELFVIEDWPTARALKKWQVGCECQGKGGTDAKYSAKERGLIKEIEEELQKCSVVDSKGGAASDRKEVAVRVMCPKTGEDNRS